MSYPWTSAQIAAIGRLADYNGSPYNATTNPYGLAQGGHRINFGPATNNISTAAGAVKDAADFAGAKADAAATSASDAATSAAKLSGTSMTAVAIGSGSKSFTTQAGKFFDVGRTLRIVSAANPNSAYMVGKVTGYSGTALTVSVLLFVGAGSPSDWIIFVDGELGPSGTITIASVTSLAPDQAPTVTNNGTASAASLAIGIPRGMPSGLYFKWSTNNAATDPTTGRVKASSGSLTDATVLYISEIDANGVPQSATIGSWDDSTNVVRGQLRIEDIANPANFVIFNLTGDLSDKGAWDTLPVAFIDKGGTLADGVSVRLDFARAGNVGNPGAPGTNGAAATIEVRTTTTGSSGSAASVTNAGTASAAVLDFTIPRGATGATGPVVATRYNFDTVTTDSDPSNGNVRFNNATTSSVTLIYLDNVEATGGITMTGFIDTFDDSTNPSGKGVLTFKDVNDQSKFAIYVVTGAVVDGSGYRKVPVTWLAGSSGFTAGANLGMTFDRAGDKGADGGGAGNVIGPASATDGGFALFSGTTGKLLQSGQAPGSLAYKNGVNNTDWSGAALGVANGGTGATTPSGARTNLGVVPGADVQAYSAKLAAIDGATWAANSAPYYISATQVGTYTLTALGRTLAGSTDAAAAQTTLQLRPGVEVQAYHANLAALAGLAGAANKFAYFTGAGAMSLIGLGNAANSVPILDANGKVLASTLPALAISDTFVVASQSAMLALTAERGDVAVRTDINKSYILKADDPTALANWQELLTPTDLVQSVAGLQGTISVAQLKSALAYALSELSGLLQAAQFPALTGAITTTAGSLATSLATGIVTYANLATAALATAASDIWGNVASKVATVAGLWSANAFTALTDAATIAVDLNTGFNFRVTLAGNRSLGAPTNLKDGQSGIIRIKQDATGSRTLTYASAWKFPGGTPPTLSTAANAVDRFAYLVTNDGSSLIVECTALEKGIA